MRFFWIIFFFIGYQGYAQNSKNHVNDFWPNIEAEYLRDSLWIDSLKYDASDFLMVLMHHAFKNNLNERIDAFDNHFKNIIVYPSRLKGSNRLADLQYAYLFSRYIVLKAEREKDNGLTVICAKIITDYIEPFWNNYEIKVYKGGEVEKTLIFSGFKERLYWKQNDSIYPKNIGKKTIVDEELFYFAIVADISYINKLLNIKSGNFISETEKLVYEVFDSRITQDNNCAWLFETGYRDNAPDYLYAGYSSKNNVKEPKPIKNVNRDVSHFRRFPLWLYSFSNGYLNYKGFFLELYKGTNYLFFKNIYIPPTDSFPYPLLNNFVDGKNGLYRYQYKTLAKGDGYGPSELSYALLGGWYSFIESDSIKSIYKGLLNLFPLENIVLPYYIDKSKRKRHPFIEDYFYYEFAQIITSSASEKLLEKND